jgi:protein O-mannosyl-transferase
MSLRLPPPVYHVLLLCGLCFLIYANALTGAFVWDDSLQVVRNESIRSLENIPEMFTSSVWSFAGASTASNKYYRPIQTVIFAIVYRVAGLSPFAYHLANVMLHTAATLMVYVLCRELRLFGSMSLLPAALFAVHPVHVEAVTWIAGAGELACGLFYVTALWAFLRYWNVRKVRWLGLSAAAFLLALFAKEMAVTFPLVALLVALMKRGDLQVGFRKMALSIVPFLGALGIYGGFRLGVLGGSVPSTLHTEASILDWATLSVWMFGQYLRYAFAPYPLAPFHLVALHFSDRTASTVLYALLIAATATLLYLMRDKARTGLFWAGIFAVTLSPVFYFKGISGGSFIFAERYLYIPTVPAMVLLAVLCMQLPRDFLIGAATILVAAFSFATVLQNRAWQSDKALFARSAAVYPENSYAWANLGGMYLNDGDDVQAEEAFKRAKRHIAAKQYMQPSYTEYLVELGLGTMAARRGVAPQAISHLERALALNPLGDNAYTVLASVLINLEQRFDAAIPLLEKAIELNPVDDYAIDALGVALFQKGQYGDAAERFREALRINPGSQLAQQHLAEALRRHPN